MHGTHAGEEKETRDGHYAYRTVGAFHAVRPLECGNQHEVSGRGGQAGRGTGPGLARGGQWVLGRWALRTP